MRYAAVAGGSLVVMGIIGLTVSILTGQVEVLVLVIVPVFLVDGLLPILSLIALFVGVVLLLASGATARRSGKGGRGRTTWGGVVFIGPIPIFFGNWKGLSLWSKLAIVLLWLFLFLLASFVVLSLVL